MRNLVFLPMKSICCVVLLCKPSQTFALFLLIYIQRAEMGWVRWVLAYLTHDMGSLVMQFEEMYQGKVNKYMSRLTLQVEPLEDIQLDLTHSSYTQKFYECCHVCHSQWKLPSLQKTSNWNGQVCQTKNRILWQKSLVLRIRQKREKSGKARW